MLLNQFVKYLWTFLFAILSLFVKGSEGPVSFEGLNGYGMNKAMIFALEGHHQALMESISHENFSLLKSDFKNQNLFHLLLPLSSDFFLSERDEIIQLDLYRQKLKIHRQELKSFEVFRRLIQSSEIETKHKISALKERSFKNLTSVSQAAFFGYYKIYDLMRDFLITHKAWNDDDHSLLGDSIDLVALKGLKKYQEKIKGLGDSDSLLKEDVKEKIKLLEQAYEEKYKTVLYKFYDASSSETRRNLNLLKSYSKKFLKGKKDSLGDFKGALRSVFHNLFRSQDSTNPLFILRVSSLNVRISYLIPFWIWLAESYVSKKKSEEKFSFKDVYVALTGRHDFKFFSSLSKSYFDLPFNRKLYTFLKESCHLKKEEIFESYYHWEEENELGFLQTSRFNDESNMGKEKKIFF